MIKPNKYFTNRTTLCNNEVMSTTQPSHSETQSPWHFELRHRLALTLEVSGMSVQEMADHLGVSANTVGNYTSGRTAPKRPVLVMWAMRTGAPLEWILTGEDPTDPTNEKTPTRGGGGLGPRLLVEPPAGLEPATYALQGDRTAEIIPLFQAA